MTDFMYKGASIVFNAPCADKIYIVNNKIYENYNFFNLNRYDKPKNKIHCKNLLNRLIKRLPK